MDEIITFNHLTEENFLGIADIMLSELQGSLSARGLTLSWDDELRRHLVKKAYSVTYGARNLRRTIQKELEDPISEAIIDSFEHPISAIRIRMDGDEVKLDITSKPGEAPPLPIFVLQGFPLEQCRQLKRQGTVYQCHCEERSDVAIRFSLVPGAKSGHGKGERIAAPVCALARNDGKGKPGSLN